MEINKYTDIIGVVATESIVEGRMVVLTAANATHDFGSREDLMGVKLPANSTEAAKARYVLAFALDNRPTPLLETIPSYSYALRKGGWDQTSNVPFTASVYLSHPGNMTVPQTVASGSLALAFDRGVFTVTSGNFVYSANLVPGAPLTVSNTSDHGADSGKLRYDASGAIGIVERFDSTNFTLTFRTL